MMELTYKEINKLFISFLKENNALKAYRKNYIKYCKISYPDWKEINYLNPLSHIRLKDLVQKNLIDSLIDYSFYWGDTEEGIHFWQELNNKWWEKCKNDKITLKKETI